MQFVANVVEMDVRNVIMVGLALVQVATNVLWVGN